MLIKMKTNYLSMANAETVNAPLYRSSIFRSGYKLATEQLLVAIIITRQKCHAGDF